VQQLVGQLAARLSKEIGIDALDGGVLLGWAIREEGLIDVITGGVLLG
jgi:hypothetical protein